MVTYGFFSTTVASTLAEKVVIDCAAYYKFQQEHKPELTALKPEISAQGSEDSNEDVGEEQMSTSSGMTDGQCMLAVSFVRGYALKSKEWCKSF